VLAVPAAVDGPRPPALGGAAPAAAHPVEDPNDVDHDKVQNADDNCPNDFNPDQSNVDHDGTGDACDDDDDNDGVRDGTDNCPRDANPDQADADHNGAGDACDKDEDADGVRDDTDNCRGLANGDQTDNDRDGKGDPCDDDDDNDRVLDSRDNCPVNDNADQADGDGDGKGDACDDPADSASLRGGSGAPTPAAVAGDRDAPGLRLIVDAAQRLPAIRAGVIVGARCSEGCVLRARIVLSPRQARRLGLSARRPVTIGAGGATVSGAASTFVIVRLSRKAKVRLAHARGVRAVLSVVARDGAGNRRLVRRGLVLSR
jgi:hypothetical protein